MKPTKRRWLRLAIAPGLAALAMIGFASQAQAADYVGNCAGVPASVTGNATIGTAGAACTIPAAGVNATGNITVAGSTISTTGNLTAGNSLTLNASSNVNIKAVNATGAVNLTTTAGTIKTTTLTAGSQQTIQVNGIGNVTTGAISAGSSFKAVSTMGTVFLNGTVTTNTGGGGGNVLIRAGLNVRAGAISTSGGAKTGGVQIDANLLGGSTLFTIGSSATNGVASINTSNTSGGGFAGDFIMGGIQITNGDANSAGGITVTAMNKINVVASASRSGVLNLNAQNGTLTLPTGVLSSDGTSGAGQIALLANTLTTVNGTQISASQPSTAPNTIHGVVIAANTINVAGLSGLTVKGDGNGYVTAGAYVTILPKGAVTLSSNNNFISYLWTMSSFNLGTNAAVTVAGASAPITLQANGDNSQVTVSGYPIAFNNGAVNLTAKGSLFGGHNIVVQYTGTFSGTNGLTFGGNGAVTFNTSGITGNDSAGHITVLVDQSSINSTVPSVTMTANGVGTGNGGTINYQPTKVVTLASPIVNISANGQFGYVNFNPRANSTTWGDLSITSTTFNLNANGPTTGNGNAGAIFFASANSTFAASTKMKFSAIGPTSGSGNGGNITVFPGNVAGGTFKLGTNAGNLQVLANAGSTGGDGGLINVNPFPGSISIETANAVSATASSGAAANSKGGNVTLIGNPNVTVVPTVVGAVINVDGKGTSDGGTIKIWGNGTLNLGNAAGSLALSAKAAGTGNGGTIEVQYVTQLTISDLQVQAGNGVGSNGNGGTVNIQNIGSLTVGSSNISAMGQGDGNGGHVTLNATLPVNIVTLSVNASAGSSGQGAGGFATVSSATGNTGVPLRPNTIFNVNAGTSTPVATQAGTIALNGVTCTQWKTGTGTGSTSWPKTYWNCAHAVPESYETAVPNAVLGLPASFRSPLGTQEVPMYIFDLGASYESYFKGASYGGGLGVSDFTIPYAVIFEYITGLNVTAYLPGNMMHELGHHIDNYTTPTIASAAPAFVTAVNSTISAMRGTWPSPPNPTCAQVFGTSPEASSLCASWAPRNPWDIFREVLIDPQDIYHEMFANYFQVCSGYSSSIPVKQTALKSTYANSLRNYFHTVFWPGGCAP